MSVPFCRAALDRRLMTAAFLLGKRRAEGKAKRELEDIADRFEEVNEQTVDEIHALRAELDAMRLGCDAIAERAETRWLH